MHVRIVRRRLKRTARSDFDEAVKSHKFPNPAKAEGIKAYLVVDSGLDEVTTVSIFDNAESLAKWNRTLQESFQDSAIAEALSSDIRDVLVITGQVVNSK